VVLQQGSHFVGGIGEAPYLSNQLFVLFPVGKAVRSQDILDVFLSLTEHPIHMLRKSYYIHHRISL